MSKSFIEIRKQIKWDLALPEWAEIRKCDRPLQARSTRQGEMPSLKNHTWPAILFIHFLIMRALASNFSNHLTVAILQLNEAYTFRRRSLNFITSLLKSGSWLLRVSICYEVETYFVRSIFPFRAHKNIPRGRVTWKLDDRFNRGVRHCLGKMK